MSEPLPRTAADYFGGMAESYDSLIRRAVPRYEEMTDRLLAHLPAGAARVLELGCGTGNLSLQLAERFPDAWILYVDAAPEMVELTRQRLAQQHAGDVSRADFLVARFEDLRLDGADYDLVVSSISLHHVMRKDLLYAGIRRGLRSGGALRFADQMHGATSFNHEIIWQDWLAFARAHCTPEEVEHLIAHSEQHDHYISVAEQFRLLGEAGFRNFDCVWRSGMWSVITADA